MLRHAADTGTLDQDMAADDDTDGGVWLTPPQVAAVLHVSVETVRRLAREGRLPHIKVGGSLRFKRSVIENLDQLDIDT